MREGLLRKWNAFLTPHFARRTGTFDSDITCVATMAALPFSESIAATVRALDTVQAEIEHLTQQIQEVERTNPTDYVRLDGWMLLQQRLKGLEDDRRTCTRFAALLTFLRLRAAFFSLFAVYLSCVLIAVVRLAFCAVIASEAKSATPSAGACASAMCVATCRARGPLLPVSRDCLILFERCAN